MAAAAPDDEPPEDELPEDELPEDDDVLDEEPEDDVDDDDEPDDEEVEDVPDDPPDDEPPEEALPEDEVLEDEVPETSPPDDEALESPDEELASPDPLPLLPGAPHPLDQATTKPRAIGCVRRFMVACLPRSGSRKQFRGRHGICRKAKPLPARRQRRLVKDAQGLCASCANVRAQGTALCPRSARCNGWLRPFVPTPSERRR
jgi:hypothetical protein